jgi:hypothetical protein
MLEPKKGGTPHDRTGDLERTLAISAILDYPRLMAKLEARERAIIEERNTGTTERRAAARSTGRPKSRRG